MNENVRRWMVLGIALNRCLVSSIRSFVEQAIEKEYNSLKATHNIHIQSSAQHLKRWPPRHILKYENINGNDCHPKHFTSRFDCRVLSHIDFAKLYVPCHLAKFNAFDDNCDTSVVLLLLAWVPAFSSAVHDAAHGVRGVRNEWARGVISRWHEDTFVQSFHLMEDLVKVMGLPVADEGKLLQELQDWKYKG